MWDQYFWYHFKQVIVDATAISRDGLHLLVGVGSLFFFAALTRRPISSPIPWLLLVGATLANEAYDLTNEIWPGRHRYFQWSESVHDFWNTMLAPTVLLLLASFWAEGRWMSGEEPPGGSS